MTDLVLKKLEQQLQCSICLEIYKDPKLLQCLHIYCKECLSHLVVKDKQGPFTLMCPICRQKTTISDNGVASLKPAFHINHLLEIREDLKNQDQRLETPVKDIENRTTVFCSHHIKKEVELYCESCEILICLKCAIKGGKHHSHNYTPLSEAFEKCKTDISTWLEPVEKQTETIREALNKLEERSSDVLNQKELLESRINNSASAVYALVETKKTELIDKLQKISEDKLEMLTSQRSGLESSFSQLISCLDFVKAGLNTDTPSKILHMKSSVSTLIEELLSSFGSETCEPVTQADIEFMPTEHNTEILGQVHALGSSDGKLSHASGVGLTSATVGKNTKFVIHAVNYLGKKCEEPIRDLRCELVSNVKDTKVTGTVVKSSKESDTEVTYCPRVPGRHQLHITINGSPISGSPFSVLVQVQVQTLTSSVITIKEIMSPWGIAVSERDDEIVASTTALNCISIFSRTSGALLRSFGGFRSGFKSPRGITLDKDSNLFLCDCENHRILKFTLDGKFLSSAGSIGRDPLQFYYPKDVAYNSVTDKIYIVDSNDRVNVLSSSLSPIGMFGTHGSGIGEFDNPCGITCDKSGNVYVADTYNHRIQVFNAEKEFVAIFGSRGKRDGDLFDPISIAVDSCKDILYVSEGSRVSIFTTKGKFIVTSKKKESCIGLTVDNEGLVYVCNSSKNQIDVY